MAGYDGPTGERPLARVAGRAGAARARAASAGEPSPLIFHLPPRLRPTARRSSPRPGRTRRVPLGAGRGRCAAELGPTSARSRSPARSAARLTATLRGLETLAAPPLPPHASPSRPRSGREGTTRLLDFGAAPEASDPAGPPVLVVPSLINRAYIVDLAPGRSLLRWLAAEGFRPALLDWGEPGRREAAMDLDAYGARAAPAGARRAARRAGRTVAVLGYCMGGTLAAGSRRGAPEGIAALATIGAPWDFASPRGIAGGLRALMRPRGTAQAEALIDAQAEAFGLVPVRSSRRCSRSSTRSRRR